MTTLSKRMRSRRWPGFPRSLVMAGMLDDGHGKPCARRPPRMRSAIRSRSATSNDSTYADGVYTATGQYGGLPSSITVTVTLADDVITAVEVTPHATNPTSLDLQRRFAAAVPAVVVGKRIDEVNVDRLAGSSGTPGRVQRRDPADQGAGPDRADDPRTDTISRRSVGEGEANGADDLDPVAIVDRLEVVAEIEDRDASSLPDQLRAAVRRGIVVLSAPIRSTSRKPYAASYGHPL